MHGREYVCAGLTGGKGESLSVNVDTGRWAEFNGLGSKGGDLIALYAAIQGIGQGEAFRQLDDGHTFTAPVAAPEPRLGPPPVDAPGPDLSQAEARWCYRTPDGHPWFYVARYPGKRIRPWAWDLDAQAWVQRGLPKPRPLYGLELLAARPEAAVLIVEGEKSAEAAHVLAGHVYVCMTWPNGASAISSADWAPLHGRKVLIWPDADDPGRQAASTIAELLAPHCPEVKLLDPTTDDPAGLPQGWDAADALAQGWDWDRFRAWAKPRITLYTQSLYDPPKTALAAPLADSVTAPQVLAPTPVAPTLAVTDDSGDVPKSLIAIYEKYGLSLTAQLKAETNADNVNRVLTKIPGFAGMVYYDEFYESIFNADGREWTDADTSRLLIRFQRELHFKRISKDALIDGLMVSAHENTRNAPRDWMDTLVWDGKPRLDTFLPTYTGCEDNDYTRTAGRNWWISMVARIYQPGCKVDTMLILLGEQGRFKSTLFSVIGGPWYAVATADAEDPKAFAETMRGKMLLELAELVSFGRAEENAIKRLLTDRADRYRASFGRFAEDHPRRCVLVGTTNKQSVLNDETGARRFWPVRIQNCDIEALERDRSQLFAEAVHRFKAGATWWEMPNSALDAQEHAREHDAWESIIEEFIEGKPSVTILDILKDGLGIAPRDARRPEQLRIGKILRTLGWEMVVRKVNKKATRVFIPMEPPF